MREIEFRGKSKNDGKWYYGKLLNHKRIITLSDDEVEEMSCFDMCDYQEEVYEETIGQYTGYKDKNGKKIFENDIIFLEEEKLYGLVCFEYGRWYVFWYGWIDKEGIGYVFDIVNENPLDDENTNNNQIWLEIVGNKYENPELLEGV